MILNSLEALSNEIKIIPLLFFYVKISICDFYLMTGLVRVRFSRRRSSFCFKAWYYAVLPILCINAKNCKQKMRVTFFHERCAMSNFWNTIIRKTDRKTKLLRSTGVYIQYIYSVSSLLGIKVIFNNRENEAH